MCRPMWVFAPFWSENGSHFGHFGLESGMVYGGTTGVYECIYRFKFQMIKKEREICEFEIDLNNFFVCALI